jgi:CHASE2 domain-containing sensor protein
MTFSGIACLTRYPEITDAALVRLGYPDYALTYLGIAKLCGVAAILLPVPARLREWGYAGLSIEFLVATASYLLSGHTSHVVPPLAALTLVLTSYAAWHARHDAARPADGPGAGPAPAVPAA